jgi:peroxisomal 3,2-trans-enoyl-CoA isomerase
MGAHRVNVFLMFGTNLTAEDLERYGVVQPAEEFHESVKEYLRGHLADKDPKSIMEVKRLQNASFRDQRIVAVSNAVDPLAERFVEGAPVERFRLKKEELLGTC